MTHLRFLHMALAFGLWVAQPAMAEPARKGKVIINDPLAGRTRGEQVGGTLAATGYQPGVGHSHILYELPKAVVQGRMEVEVFGMDSSVEGQPAFFAMYDGRGIEEPIKYAKGEGIYPFRENYFRFNLHWRSEKGGLKFVFVTAKPSTAAALDPVSMSASYYRPKDEVKVRDFVKEPCCKNPGFDPKKWHKLAVEWARVEGLTSMKVLVDGKDIGLSLPNGSPYPYAPGTHRIWLGAARGKYAQTNPALVMRNFKLISFDGTIPALQKGTGGHRGRTQKNLRHLR